MIAVTLPPDLGELCDNELKILMAQRKRVNNVPSLPGMAEIGMRKLVWKLRLCFAYIGNRQKVCVGLYHLPMKQ